MTVKNGASYRDRPPRERTEASKKFERDLDATLANIDAGRTCETCRRTKYERQTGETCLVCWKERTVNGITAYVGKRVDPDGSCESWAGDDGGYEPRGRRTRQ